MAKHGKPGNYARRQLDTWGRQFRMGLDQMRSMKGKVTEDPNYGRAMAETARMEQLMAMLEAKVDTVSQQTGVVHGDFRLGNLILHPTECVPPPIASPIAHQAYRPSYNFHRAGSLSA